MTTDCAGRLARPAQLLCALASAALLAAPGTAQIRYYDSIPLAQPAPDRSIDAFYAARGGPLWFGEDGGFGAAPDLLFGLLRTAEADGLPVDRARLDLLSEAMRAAESGDPRAIAWADRQLSEAFVAHVRATRRTPEVPIIWVDASLKPDGADGRAILEAAAAAPSLEAYLAEMRWMHPIYAGLRRALASGRALNDTEFELMRLNLERARALPAGQDKLIVVNATAATLTMYEEDRAVDSMRVVVGKPAHATPSMAALIRFTSLNPYWNVPTDLAAERVAPSVVKSGLSYLAKQGYEVMSGWEPDARVLDPATVDWQAVLDGTDKVILRQRPGPNNAMGQMKFMFPNAQGIYLHDTPQKELLGEASRMFSGGCVRLEDAPRLARWLYGEMLAPRTNAPEERVNLPRPVPVFLTYLTIVPGEEGLTFLPDVYDRDQRELAALRTGPSFASR